MLGGGALHAFEYRMHDTRIGRFWSVDPLAGKFPWNSVYAFAENSPVGFLELEGLEKFLAITMGEDVKYRSAFLKATDADIETFHIQLLHFFEQKPEEWYDATRRVYGYME